MMMMILKSSVSRRHWKPTPVMTVVAVLSSQSYIKFLVQKHFFIWLQTFQGRCEHLNTTLIPTHTKYYDHVNVFLNRYSLPLLAADTIKFGLPALRKINYLIH